MIFWKSALQLFVLTILWSMVGFAKPTFAGFTSSVYTGDMNYTKGMVGYCEAYSSGSHPCTYNEIKALGNDYPYTYDAWVIDGSVTIDGASTGADGDPASQLSKDGYAIDNSTAPRYPKCYGWGSGSISYAGPYMGTGGAVYLTNCNQSRRIPCCK